MMYGISKDHQIKVQRQKCADLKARLEKGWALCDANPDNKEYESHWLKLLAEYQREVFTLTTLGGKEPV